MSDDKPTLAVWKFSSCDGCQLTLLNCEDELLAVADGLTIAHFTEATRAVLPGPYDLSLVEGSVTTPEEAERIRHVRRVSHRVVTIGACATAGGIQALRNFADADEMAAAVYPTPAFLSTLATSTAISSHIDVDFELRGCPINKGQLIEVITAFLQDRSPRIPNESVCVECKRRGNPCVLVTKGVPCLGPVTQSGCGALCPSYDRGCYGCFGPAVTATPQATASLSARFAEDGAEQVDVLRLFRTFNAGAEAFSIESVRHEPTG